MTGTPRRPWTPERDKELRKLAFSASSAETIAETLNRTTFTSQGEHSFHCERLPGVAANLIRRLVELGLKVRTK
jgi:hypothetical protein